MKRRLAYLDSIRALAAIGVACFHAALYALPSAAGFEHSILYLVTNIIDIGKVGVTAFFMVSGFVIPISLKGGKPKRPRLPSLSRLLALPHPRLLRVLRRLFRPLLAQAPAPKRHHVPAVLRRHRHQHDGPLLDPSD